MPTAQNYLPNGIVSGFCQKHATFIKRSYQSVTWSRSASSSLIWVWITVFFCCCILQS